MKSAINSLHISGTPPPGSLTFIAPSGARVDMGLQGGIIKKPFIFGSAPACVFTEEIVPVISQVRQPQEFPNSL